jgi:hypothetical protein
VTIERVLKELDYVEACGGGKSLDILFTLFELHLRYGYEEKELKARWPKLFKLNIEDHKSMITEDDTNV